MSTLAKIRQNASTRDRVVVAFVALLAIAIASVVLGRAQSVKVHVVNALDVPVEVEIDGRKVTVPSATPTPISVSPGIVRATTWVDGRVVETVSVHADPHSDVVVYNVLGAAPVLLADIVYTAIARSSEPKVTLLAGARVHDVRSADYVFERPPQSVSTKSHGDVHKTALLYAGLEGRGDWTSTVGYLLQKGKAEEAFEIVRRVASVSPYPLRAVGYADRTASAAFGEGGSLPLLAGLLHEGSARGDGKSYVTSSVVWEACRLGMCERARKLFAAARGLDATATTLADLRTKPKAEHDEKLAELARAMPDDPEVQRVVAWRAASTGRWEDCAARHARLGMAFPSYRVADRALCLFGAGRTSEATALLEPASVSQSEIGWSAALMLARIHHASGKASPERSLDKLAGKENLGRQHALVALEIGTLARSGTEKLETTDYLAAPIGAARKALNGPASALDAFARLGDATSTIPAPLLLVVGGEAARRGDVALATKLFDAARGFALPAPEAIAYVVEGIEPPNAHRIDAEERAALDLARARRLAALGKDVTSEYASIRERDILKGWVTRLLDEWPAPEKKDDVVTYAADR